MRFFKGDFMKLKIINKSKHPLPEYETSGSSGMDLRANLDNELIIEPFDRVLVPTGLFLAQLVFMKIEIPEIQEVEKINNTKRSDGGFGHTGL